MMDQFQERLQVLAIQFPPFMAAVVFHEFAHGFVAHRWGDNTAKDAGRLTLNPLPHLDPIGTVLFPAIGMLSGINLLFGWAKPVPIDPSRFKSLRPGLFWVSLAGPGTNFLLAVISAFIFCAIEGWMPKDSFLYQPLKIMAFVSVSLNYMLGFFNLIPLPPLDGSKIIESFLPTQLARKYESLAQYSFFILIALIMLGAFRFMVYPVQFLSNLTLILVAQTLGVPLLHT